MANHVTLTADANPIHQMQSGVGASWHALLRPPVGHGGSAFGGQPPVLPAREPLWKSIEQHADHLRLRFIRAEFEWKHFEPERNEFTWETPEMQILDRICAWAQRAGADVILQHMWGGVTWNSFPEFRGDPALETYSAPADLEAFADGWMRLLSELREKRGYRCIRWINLVNEPGHWWWQLPESYDLLWEQNNRAAAKRLMMDYYARACAVVRKRLKCEHPSVQLMGPDETDLPVYSRLADEPWFPHVDDIDFHSYHSVFDHEELPNKWSYHLNDRIDGLVRRYCDEAHAAGKGCFLSEVGSMVYGWGGDNPAPGSHLASLKDSELLIRALSAGIDGFSHWSFTNRGDMDGQWQLVDTWNRESKNWLPLACPHRPAYDLLGRAMRHVPKCATIFPVEVCADDAPRNAHPRVRAVAVQDPDTKSINILIVNNSEEPLEFTLTPQGLPSSGTWSMLDSVSDTATPLEKSLVNGGNWNGLLPALQLSILTG